MYNYKKDYCNISEGLDSLLKVLVENLDTLVHFEENPKENLHTLKKQTSGLAFNSCCLNLREGWSCYNPAENY